MKRYLRVGAWACIWLLVVLSRRSFPSVTGAEYLAFVAGLLLLCALDLYVSWWPERVVPTQIRRYAYTALVLLLLLDMLHAGYYLTQHHPFDPYLQMPPHRYVLPPKDSNEVRILCLGAARQPASRCQTPAAIPTGCSSACRHATHSCEYG